MIDRAATEQGQQSRRYLALLLLVCAGESIFFLPFLLPRVFRPTMLEVFGLTNLQLGTAFALYGTVGMVAYVLGGPLADFFCPRKLIVTALIATALGGVALWSIPSLATLKWIYASWGFTTIALFWSALIRTTREWGGKLAQGSAFGLLDGGRGLLAAITGSCAVALYAALLPADVESATLGERTHAFQQVIMIFTTMVVVAAFMSWWWLPGHAQQETSSALKPSFRGSLKVLQMPVVWLQAIIIVCAYVGYKAADDFSLYAKEVLQLDEVQAATIGAYSLWVRPIAAIGAGYLADRFKASNMMIASFLLLIVGSLFLATDFFSPMIYPSYVLIIICTSIGIFALRGLYYAIMEEGRVPLAYTGSVVGIVSMLGYTPDIFMGPLMGVLLDKSPGAPGHQHFFMVILLFSLVGFVASCLVKKYSDKAE